jgi:hypothetical protein
VLLDGGQEVAIQARVEPHVVLDLNLVGVEVNELGSGGDGHCWFLSPSVERVAYSESESADSRCNLGDEQIPGLAEVDCGSMVVMSYGMGADSTAILMRWLTEPASRDFDLQDLVVITAHTG